MKTKIAILIVLTMFLAQACSTVNKPEAGSPQNPVNPPATETTQPNTPEVIQSTAEVSTAVALSALPTQTLSPGGNIIPEGGITLDDRGKTFTLKVGEGFLLNLGTDTYDWTVTIDNESVLHMKMGVMVIKGAQGIYDALAPGTVLLSATGDPLCRQSKPACGAPSIIFTVTLVVK